MMEFYVKYWQSYSSAYDLYVEEYQNTCSLNTLPNKDLLLLHNNLLEAEIEKNIHKCKEVYITLTGGELFCSTNKEMFEGFDLTIQALLRIKELAERNNKVLQIKIHSTLMYEDLDLIKYVITKSFDKNLSEIK